MEYKVRESITQDLEQLSILFDHYRIFYNYPSDVQSAKNFLSERMNKNESVIIVAESGEELIGFIQFYPLFSSTRMKRLWLLNDLFVSSNYRKKGVGKILIEKAKLFAKDTQSCGFILETANLNLEANQLYKSALLELDTEHNYYAYNC